MPTDPATIQLPQYLKFLTAGGRGPFSDFAWPIGEWVEIEGPLVMCERGIHVTTIEHATEWLNDRCHPVEVRGELIEGDTKVCVRAARLGPALETWTERTARLYAADCAERVLPIFERECPNDDRPRKAIEAARAFAYGEIDDAALAAADPSTPEAPKFIGWLCGRPDLPACVSATGIRCFSAKAASVSSAWE